jgi:hypothetical protein
MQSEKPKSVRVFAQVSEKMLRTCNFRYLKSMEYESVNHTPPPLARSACG